MNVTTPRVARLDTTAPHSARVWDYWLLGKDNFAADRTAGDLVSARYPQIIAIVHASRAFQARAVRHLVAERGVGQFLDIGPGLPRPEATHAVAQQYKPAARVVYIDNDPVVLVHCRALADSHPDGRVECLDADMRTDRPRLIAEAATTLDMGQPIAVLLLDVLSAIPDYRQARTVVRDLMAAVPAGSFLVINDGVTVDPAAVAASAVARGAGLPYHLRHPDEFRGYLDGLDLVDPGVVTTPGWRPDDGAVAAELASWCAVARKPA